LSELQKNLLLNQDRGDKSPRTKALTSQRTPKKDALLALAN
jgi:hypothetical protein